MYTINGFPLFRNDVTYQDYNRRRTDHMVIQRFLTAEYHLFGDILILFTVNIHYWNFSQSHLQIYVINSR